MPNKKSKATKPAKSGGQKKAEDVVMWVRLPRPMNAAELSKAGLKGAACYGGDTCIAATSMRNDVGIVVQMSSAEALKKAKITRVKDPCFGGDTCIV